MKIIDRSRLSLSFSLDTVSYNGTSAMEYIEKTIAYLQKIYHDISEDYEIEHIDDYGYRAILFYPTREQTPEEIAADAEKSRIKLNDRSTGENFAAVDRKEFDEFRAWQQAKFDAANRVMLTELSDNMTKPHPVSEAYIEWEKNHAVKNNS